MIESPIEDNHESGAETLISIKTKRLGLVTISEVDEAIAFGAYQPDSPEMPQRGDLVVYAK